MEKQKNVYSEKEFQKEFRSNIKKIINDENGIVLPLGKTEDDKLVYVTLGDKAVHACFRCIMGNGKFCFTKHLVYNLNKYYTEEKVNVKYISSNKINLDIINCTQSIFIKDNHDIMKAMQSIVEEIEDIEQKLLSANCCNIKTYNEQHPDNPIKPTIVILDNLCKSIYSLDFKDTENFKKALNTILKVSRFTGLHLLLMEDEYCNLFANNTIDGFAIRIVSKCTEEISAQMIGAKTGIELNNPSALIVNTHCGYEPEKNIRVERPFISDEEFESFQKE